MTAPREYIQRLGPIERACEGEVGDTKSANPFSQAVASTVLPGLTQTVPTCSPRLKQSSLSLLIKLPMPHGVVFVRTTGLGEGNAPTLAPTQSSDRPSSSHTGSLPRVLAHELFHIASRQDKGWRDMMYATVGFVSIEEVALPQQLAARVITNPDAPRIDVAIKVQTDDGMVWVAPLLQSTADGYDAARGGEFFAYLKLVWLEVARGERPPQRAELAQPPRLFDTKDLRGFHEQVGRNTGYIIHPEEILADNFAQLATRQTGRSPEVHQRLREALQRHAQSTAGNNANSEAMTRIDRYGSSARSTATRKRPRRAHVQAGALRPIAPSNV